MLGHFLLGVGNQRNTVVMLGTKFFLERAIQCNTLAARATDGNHREILAAVSAALVELRARQRANAGNEMLPVRWSTQRHQMNDDA